jgi:hypothetical protein
MSTTNGEAKIIEHEDGLTVFLIEGIGTKEDASRVCARMEEMMDRAVKSGKTRLVIAVPPSVKLKVARGKSIDMKTTADGRVTMSIVGTPRGEGLLIPGRDF